MVSETDKYHNMEKLFVFILIISIFSNLAFSKDVKLKSYQEIKKTKVKDIKSFICSLKAIDKKGNETLLSEKKISLSLLREIDPDGLRGYYFDVQGALGLSVYQDKKDQLIFEIESEDSSKRIIEKFNQFPLKIQTRVEMNLIINKKEQQFIGVSLDCDA